MKLDKFKKGDVVTVTTTCPDTYTSWPEKQADGTVVTVRELQDAGTLEGTILEVGPDHLVIQSEYRSKVYEYTVNVDQIIWILKTSLTEAGKAASERMRERHATEKTK